MLFCSSALRFVGNVRGFHFQNIRALFFLLPGIEDVSLAGQ